MTKNSFFAKKSENNEAASIDMSYKMIQRKQEKLKALWVQRIKVCQKYLNENPKIVAKLLENEFKIVRGDRLTI